MDSEMASELARMKSRDVAIENNEVVFERPQIAKPKSRGGEEVKNEDTARLPPMADERRPHWQEKSAAQTSFPDVAELPAFQHLSRQHSSYARNAC